MQAKEVLEQLMRYTNMSAAELSRACGLSESAVSRTLHGKTSPSFDAINQAAQALGFTLSVTPLTPLEEATLNLIGPGMQDLLDSIRRYDGTPDQWTHVSASMRNLLEFPDAQVPEFSLVTKRMSPRWSAFMAGLYDHQQWDKKEVDSHSLILKEPWTPLRKIYPSMTSPDRDFARYNVILPKGELQWK